MDYRQRITIEPGKRGGKPCIRGLRITVYDVLEYLASGMSEAEILHDFPDLTQEDIRACLAFAADRERKLVTIPRSEEHTSELQSQSNLVCRLLLEKKKTLTNINIAHLLIQRLDQSS